MKIAKQLWFQVVIAMGLGVVFGLWRPALAADMKPFGDAFIALIRMIIPPVIFCTVVHGIAQMNDMRKVGRVAVKALIYFELITTLALAFAITAVNWWQPGKGMNISINASDVSQVAGFATQEKAPALVPYLMHIIPDTFSGAFVHGDVLQVLLVSVLFGIALTAVGPVGKPVLDIIQLLSRVFSRIVNLIMWAAPIGAFGAIAFTIGKFGGSVLWSLAQLIAEFYVVSLLFVFLVLGGMAWICGVNLVRLINYIRDEILIVAATTSSESVLPRLIQKMEELGCDEGIVGLVIPAGYSFNLDGTCLYLATAAVFLAQATNTPLSPYQQLVLVITMMLTSKGAAGVAGAAFVVLASTLSSTGVIPVASVALVLGIHRLMAEALTFVNVVGNSIATIVVAIWEGAVDTRMLYQKVGFLARRSPEMT